MHARLVGVAKSYGAQAVLEGASLDVGPQARIGLVGPNGVGKSTVLRLLAGVEQPDRGRVERDPPGGVAAYLPQEPELRAGERLRERLARLTGVAAAERELEDAAAGLAAGGDSACGKGTRALSDRYDRALAGFLALGGGDFDARAAAVCARLGLEVELERPVDALSGGERARASLAAILLVQAELLLLDEPTNDLDADGLAWLERFVDSFPGAIVVVSHDRAFLDRSVRRIAEVEPRSHAIVEYAGGWSDYARRRDEARAGAYSTLAAAEERRRELASLLARRRTDARGHGPGAGRRGTHALSTKVRQAERQLDRNPLPEKPYEPWELQLELRSTGRLPSPVVRLAGAVVERGSFRLGPIDLEVVPGERVAVLGANGSGKTTLLQLLLGILEPTEGARVIGRGVVPGVIGQERAIYGSDDTLLDAFVERSALVPVEARTLLAKFGLGASHIGRACATLSPGERTRAHLAELQARGVNLLVLDEPTNHLDLEAVEQLEGALAGWDGALVVVSHDRRFLEAVAPTREVRLG